MTPANFTPVTKATSAVRAGNAEIKASADRLGKALEATRDQLDASIVLAHQRLLTAEAAEQALQAARTLLEQALKERTALNTTVERQDGRIATLETANSEYAADKLEYERKANAQTDDLNTAKQENANYAAQKKDDERWYGLHGVFRWLGHFVFALGWRILLVAAVLVGLAFVLNIFAPGAVPILKWLAKIPVFFLGLLKKLWPFKPKTPPQ